jgi:hypothetical protein
MKRLEDYTTGMDAVIEEAREPGEVDRSSTRGMVWSAWR